MSLVAAFDLECVQMDAVSAFINAEIDSTVYVQYPPGFEQTGKYLRLKRALYGLRKSPKLWFNEISSHLKDMGFTPCPEEPCLVVHNRLPLYIFFYVDDFLIIGPTSLKAEIEKIKTQLKQKYKFKDLGEAKSNLSLTS